jgi:hypothetical protein
MLLLMQSIMMYIPAAGTPKAAALAGQALLQHRFDNIKSSQLNQLQHNWSVPVTRGGRSRRNWWEQRQEQPPHMLLLKNQQVYICSSVLGCLHDVEMQHVSGPYAHL